MAGNGYLRTVNFGGFDKKDVLAYVDELNTKIYNLETQLGEKNDTIAALEASGAGAAPSGDFEGKEILEQKIEEGQKKLEESHAKVSELMASTDSLKLQLTNVESDVAERDAQIADLKKEIEELKQKVSDAEASAAAGGGAAFDMSSLFMEAQKSANAVVVQAKEAAAKMEQDAKNLQDQILEDANTQAEKIVTTANAEAKTTTETAQAQADAILKSAREQEGVILAQSKDLRESVENEFTDLDINIQKIAGLLNEMLGDSIAKTDSIKKLTAEGLKLVNSNSNFNYIPKGSDAQKVNKKNDNGNVNLKADNSSNDDILAQLAQQALESVQQTEAKPAPEPSAEQKTQQSKASFASSLQFRDPAPDSVKPAVKKPQPEVAEEKPQPPKEEAVKPEPSKEEAAPKTEEVKVDAPKEADEKPAFHMAAKTPQKQQEEPASQAPKPAASGLGLSMSKGGAPKGADNGNTAEAPHKSAGASGLRMGGHIKSADPVSASDKDIMAALAKEIQAGHADNSLSDEDLLNEWGGKK